MPLASLVMPNAEDAGMPLVASLLKRVLDASDAIRETVSAQNSKLDRIEVQVNKTNGRVLILEGRADEFEQWRDGVASEDEQAAAYAAGAKAVRDGDRALLRRVWGRIERWVITGGAVVLGAAGERIFRLLEGWF
jgi:hypothetical protein